MIWILGVYLLTSLVALGLYGIDKAAARRDRRRIRESTLHLVALVGGWPGALLARRVFRHKTRKQPFGMILWGCVALNLGVVAWLVMADAILPFVGDDFAALVDRQLGLF